ncbi:MAG: DnaJ domain-containing protein [Firmicutes bacterium]|nr:DnaJ domain-containing protein [Bacillota bacterium]
MPAKQDYYRLLGVKPLSKKEEIKRAYKEKAKKYHPDLNPDKREYAEEKMKELTEAYDVLVDSENRMEYDNSKMFALKIPSQLRRSSAENTYTSEISKPKQSFFDKLKNIFSGKKENTNGQLMSKDIADRFSMGITYAAKKEESMLSMAKIEFEAVLEAIPGQKEAAYNLGIICYRLGDYDSALLIFRKLLSLYPDSSDMKKIISLLAVEE